MGRNLTTPRAPIRRSRIQMGERPIGDIDEVDVVTERTDFRIQMGERPIGDIDEVDVVTERTDFRIQMSEEPENSLVILT